MKTIVEMLFGSHVYGTDHAGSDLDYKGVFIPEADDILLQRAPKTSINLGTKADPHAKNSPDDVDREMFPLHAYMKLLCAGQTIAVDMLWVPQRFWITQTPLWFELVKQRDSFTSKNVTAFVGYCKQQANKYGIKGSRMNAAAAAVDLMETFGIGGIGGWKAPLGTHGPALKVFAQRTEHVEIETRRNPAGHEVEHLSVCGKLAPFTSSVDTAMTMYRQLWHRYGARARAAANNQGIDWKALMHAVRVLYQAQELLATGRIQFPRPECGLLRQIRHGALPYAKVAQMIEDGIGLLDVIKEGSTLREEPNRKAADRFVRTAYLGAILEAE
jgi:hypothetical protein